MDKTITFGGWYQRTTLHLTEIYDFLESGISRLDLDKEKLVHLRKGLKIKSVTRESDYLEFVKAQNHDGIEIRYYEDGLYVLEHTSDDLQKSKDLLEKYFEESFKFAFNYLFSLGSPTPKVLANIKTYHPLVVNVKSDNPEKYELDEKEYGEVYSKLDSEGISVYKTHGYIFIVWRSGKKHLDDFVETQIFFREYKDQLEKYLNIHRKVWEEIAQIKERKFVKGSQLEKIRARLDSYQKTIDLISNRINQMGTYIGTRRSIARELKLERDLAKLFQYKFETLSDTHAYIKELWKMTQDYLKSAIQIVVELENKSADVSIKSLRTVTMVGVISGVLGYMARDELPQLTGRGVMYFVFLITATWIANKIIYSIYRRKKYELEFNNRDTKI